MSDWLIVLTIFAAISIMFGIMGAMIDEDEDIVFGTLMLWLEMNIIGKVILFIPFGFFCLFGFIGFFLMMGFKFLIFMKF